MEKIFIKPAVPGNIVRFPTDLKRTLKDDGEWVKDSTDWQRYLRKGDVVMVTPPEQKVKQVKGDK